MRLLQECLKTSLQRNQRSKIKKEVIGTKGEKKKNENCQQKKVLMMRRMMTTLAKMLKQVAKDKKEMRAEAPKRQNPLPWLQRRK